MTAKNRTLIKLDDKIIEITHGKKGLLAKELSTDEVFEVSLLEEGVGKLIENDMNRIANEAYQELTDGFKNTLKTNVLRIAGFENRWGNGYEVDHCNGRQSMMTEYLSSRVQATITQEIDTVLTQQDLTDLLKDTKKALLKDAKDLFRREVRYLMDNQVRETAKAFVQDIIKKQITKDQKQLIKEAEAKFFGNSDNNDD